MITEKQIQKRMMQQGVGKRFLKAKIADFPSELEQAANDSFFISGKVGCGKTHLLAAVTRQYIDHSLKQSNQYISPLFISVSNFLYKLKNSFSYENKENEYDIIKEIIEQPVLCLDDFGSGSPTEWSVQVLDFLFDGRYNNSPVQKTYISSNMDLEGVANNYSERIASRITGMCKIIEPIGKDRRLEEN